MTFREKKEQQAKFHPIKRIPNQEKSYEKNIVYMQVAYRLIQSVNSFCNVYG